MQSLFDEGKRLVCPVELGSYLGSGMSGSAYEVKGAIDGCRYALKRVELQSEESVARARIETRLHAPLVSASIVRYAFCWEEEATEGGGFVLNIILERCDGELWAALISRGEHEQPSADDRLRWSVQLLNALHHLHVHGVAHRDLSPWNVWLSARCIKVGDFGLAVPLRAGETLSGLSCAEGAELDDSALGSIYSAPELGGQAYDRSVDVFSAGMVLLAIWHGGCASQRAGDEDALVQLVEGAKASGSLPSWFEAECQHAHVIGRMISHRPSMRPSPEECLKTFVGGGAFARRPSQLLHAVMHRERSYAGIHDVVTLRQTLAGEKAVDAQQRQTSGLGRGAPATREAALARSCACELQ
jgi:serine/threonine protein kinase